MTCKNRFPELEIVRLAVPGRVYTNNYMNYFAVVVRQVFERREKIKRGIRIIREASILRHFIIELEPIKTSFDNIH